LPVLVEDNETNRERVSHGNGMTFKADQSEDLRIKLMEFMTMPRAEFERMKQNAVDYVRENYDYSLICEKYMEIIYDKIYSYSKIKKH